MRDLATRDTPSSSRRAFGRLIHPPLASGQRRWINSQTTNARFGPRRAIRQMSRHSRGPRTNCPRDGFGWECSASSRSGDTGPVAALSSSIVAFLPLGPLEEEYIGELHIRRGGVSPPIRWCIATDTVLPRGDRRRSPCHQDPSGPILYPRQAGDPVPHGACIPIEEALTGPHDLGLGADQDSVGECQAHLLHYLAR